MNILFLLTGFASYDEAILISQFIDQLDETHDCACLSQLLPFSYTNTHPRIASGVFAEDKDTNSQNLQKLLEKHNFDLIVWGDIINFLLEGEPFNLSLNWLTEIDIPICILDYQDVLKIEQLETPSLENNNKYMTKISLDNFNNNVKTCHEVSFHHSNKIYVIKTCPPAKYENNNDIINLFSSDYMHQKLQPHILYWKKLEEFPLVSKYNLREVVDKDLKCNEDTKIIFLIFNPAAFLRTSVIENSFKPDIHYEAVKNLICYYLKILMMHNKINCQIFIANYPRLPNKKDYSLPLSPLDKKKSSLQIREIPLLTHELYTTLLKVSDLIITESNWHPALISSVMLEVPSIVIGSNVAIKEEKGVKKIVSDYTDMDMYVYQTLESLLKHNPASIFPYVSYPHEITFLPNINMVQNGYFYHITDIFNDERTISLFSELLLNKDYQSDLQTLFSSIKDRNKEALLAEKIVEIVIYD